MTRSIQALSDEDLVDRERRLIHALKQVYVEQESRERARSYRMDTESATPLQATPARRVS